MHGSHHPDTQGDVVWMGCDGSCEIIGISAWRTCDGRCSYCGLPYPVSGDALRSNPGSVVEFGGEDSCSDLGVVSLGSPLLSRHALCCRIDALIADLVVDDVSMTVPLLAINKADDALSIATLEALTDRPDKTPPAHIVTFLEL